MDEIDVLEQQAVDAAMNQEWKEAVVFNERILKIDDKNLGACLRLGFTHFRSKNNKEAKKYYQKALHIQPKNQVALENLERLKVLGERSTRKATPAQSAALNPSLFLEIPGKTKSAQLVNVGQKKDLAELVIGQEVELKLKKRKIEARTESGSYVGCLPDDLSKRLIFLIKAKSRYVAYIKEANLNRAVLFIKEELKGKKVSHFLSFPQNIQTNMEQMSGERPTNETEDETEDEEWEGVGHELATEEKEEQLVDIHPEEEEVEE